MCCSCGLHGEVGKVLEEAVAHTLATARTGVESVGAREAVAVDARSCRRAGHGEQCAP